MGFLQENTFSHNDKGSYEGCKKKFEMQFTIWIAFLLIIIHMYQFNRFRCNYQLTKVMVKTQREQERNYMHQTDYKFHWPTP